MAETIALRNLDAPVTWRRSARARRISLRIDPKQGGVVVTLPLRSSVAAGRAILLTHQDWVAERFARLPQPVLLLPGATVPVDGLERQIVHEPRARTPVRLEGATLVVSGEPEFLARRVQDWLRSYARGRLGALASAKAGAAGLVARRLVIKDTSSRWGSCTAEGVLMFSWRLVMAPPEVQDYVVGHEVAHLRHLNHGKQFWELTDCLTPHRRFATAWLSAHGATLMRVG